MDFEGRAFVITGASCEIGRKLSYILNEYNAKVICIYNKNKIKDYDAYKCDITNEKKVKKVFNKIKKKYKHIYGLVNIAGISIDENYEEKNSRTFKKVINTNLLGTFLMIKYFSKIIEGCIINMSSLDGINTFTGYDMDYASSKAAVNNLTLNFAKVLKNIKVCAIAPGWIKTKSTLLANPNFIKEQLKKHGQKELINPEEVAMKIIEIIVNNDYASGDIIRMESYDK